MNLHSSLLLLLVLLMAAGCMKAPQPPASASPPAADPHAGLDLPPAVESGELRFEMTPPPGWTVVPADQAFYLAKYALPGSEGGQCTVSFNVGSPALNLQRWYGQWEVEGKPAAEAAEEGSLDGAPWKATTVVLRGTLADTRQLGGGPPRPDWMLVGAILEPVQGPVFVKVVGPRSVLEPQLPAFWDSVRAARIGP